MKSPLMFVYLGFASCSPHLDRQVPDGGIVAENRAIIYQEPVSLSSGMVVGHYIVDRVGEDCRAQFVPQEGLDEQVRREIVDLHLPSSLRVAELYSEHCLSEE